MAPRDVVANIELELREAEQLNDYEAVNAFWLCLLKLANRIPGKNERHRMFALVGRFREADVGSVLSLPAVDTLLNLQPPLESLLDLHEEGDLEDAKRELRAVRENRAKDPLAALLELGRILKRIRNKREHGFKSPFVVRDAVILRAARSILQRLCGTAVEAVR